MVERLEKRLYPDWKMVLDSTESRAVGWYLLGLEESAIGGNVKGDRLLHS